MLAALEVRRPTSRISERARRRGTLLLSCTQADAEELVDFEVACPDKVGMLTTAHRDTLDQMLRNAARPSIVAARCKHDAARGDAGAARRRFGWVDETPRVQRKAVVASWDHLSLEERVRTETWPLPARAVAFVMHFPSVLHLDTCTCLCCTDPGLDHARTVSLAL